MSEPAIPQEAMYYLKGVFTYIYYQNLAEARATWYKYLEVVASTGNRTLFKEAGMAGLRRGVEYIGDAAAKKVAAKVILETGMKEVGEAALKEAARKLTAAELIKRMGLAAGGAIEGGPVIEGIVLAVTVGSIRRRGATQRQSAPDRRDQ